MLISTFKGIQNTVSKRDIEDNALQDATDVDITNAGGFIARAGAQSALQVPIDTAYTTLDDETYLVSNGQLFRILPDLTLRNLGQTTATEFCDNQRTLFTNDGKMVYQDHLSDLVVPVPDLEPSLVLTGGSQPPGIYSVIYAYANSEGVEGGTSPVATIELVSPGQVLAYPVDKVGFTAQIYMTEAGGEVFYSVATGTPINPVQVNSNVFPANAIKIEFFESKLFVSESIEDFSVVWNSKTFHYHLFGVDNAYFVIPGKIEVLRAVDAGLVIGTEKEIYLYADGGITKLANYGVVPGRPIVKLPDNTLLIHTVRGVCSFPPFTPRTEDFVSLPMGTVCSTKMVYTNGIKKFVALHDGGGEAFNQFTDN